MQIREAFIEDAEEACQVLRRSIVELCELDHKGNTDALDLWLSNKTPRNLRRWITESHVFVAAEEGVILGVAAIDNSGKITLNYVSPGARFRGVSKALIGRLEARALEFGVRTVTLESTATARGFYLSAGYEELGPPRLSSSAKASVIRWGSDSPRSRRRRTKRARRSLGRPAVARHEPSARRLRCG